MFKRFYILMDEKGEADAGGAGKAEAGKGESANELATLKADNAKLMARLDALEGKKKEELI